MSRVQPLSPLFPSANSPARRSQTAPAQQQLSTNRSRIMISPKHCLYPTEFAPFAACDCALQAAEARIMDSEMSTWTDMQIFPIVSGVFVHAFRLVRFALCAMIVKQELPTTAD